jgi:hypothetical protein
MLYIKNKATQSLVITDLRPTEALSPSGYKASSDEVKKDIPSSFNMRVGMQKDKYNNCISLIDLSIYPIK